MRLGSDSVQRGVGRCSTDWWNDHQNDHQCKLGGSGGMHGVDLNVGLSVGAEVTRSRAVDSWRNSRRTLDRAGYATLISDTSIGRPPSRLWSGRAGCCESYGSGQLPASTKPGADHPRTSSCNRHDGHDGLLAMGGEGQRSAVATAQITATLRAMTINAHSGYSGRNANMTTVLHSASTMATTRPQVRPASRPSPAPAATTPRTRWIQPQLVRRTGTGARGWGSGTGR